jgi:beta-lactamase superfamily II metal-dependent hydrolase
VHPEDAVISDGYLNHFHFPSPTVLNRYRDAGVRVIRTDTDGAVMLDASRRGMTIRGARWQLVGCLVELLLWGT